MKGTSKREGSFSVEKPFFFSFHDTRVRPNAKKTGETVLKDNAQTAAFHEGHSYLSYLWQIFRRGTPYLLFRRARAFFYPALFLGRLFRIAKIVFRTVEASAVLLLALTLFFILFPPLLLLVLALLLLTAIENRQADRRFARLFEEKNVLAFFRTEPSPFFLSLAASLADKYTVLIVTDLPHAFFDGRSGRGILAARQIGDGVLAVREQYFFHLRRRLLKNAARFVAIC